MSGAQPSASLQSCPIPGILKQGYLTKKGQNYKTWRKRYFVVLDGYILYFKDEKDLFHPQGVIYLQDSFLDRDPFYQKMDNTFVIRAQSKRFMLSAETMEEKEAWVRVLDRIINQSSMRAKFQQQSAAASTSSSNQEVVGDSLVEELQKEKETTLRVLQTLNLMEKPLGLLLSNVDIFNKLIIKNEYKSDEESDYNVNRLSRRLPKDAKNSDSDDDSSSDEELKRNSKGSEEDMRKFTLTDCTPNSFKNGSKSLNPVDRLQYMKDDLQKAFENYENTKERYVKQVGVYKSKVKARRYLSKWKEQLSELKNENKALHSDYEALKKFMDASLSNAQTSLKELSSALTSKAPTNDNGSVAAAAARVESQNENTKGIMELLKNELETLKKDLKVSKEREESLEKQVKELSHHKSLLIKEVKNLRTANKKP